MSGESITTDESSAKSETPRGVPSQKAMKLPRIRATNETIERQKAVLNGGIRLTSISAANRKIAVFSKQKSRNPIR